MPGSMTPGMEAALKGLSPILVGLLEVNLPDYDLRLIDGASEIEWGGETFVGLDPVYGSWAASEGFSDGLGDEAPALSFTLLPTSVANAAALTAPDVQESRVRVWFAVVDTVTGGVVPNPYLLFDGTLETATLAGGKQSLSLDYDCVSGLEALFVNDEGIRLSDAHHQDVWPGESGLAQVTGLVRSIIWGPGDRPAGVSYGSTAPAGGGGRFFNAEVAV